MHIRSQRKREIRFLLITIPIVIVLTWIILSALNEGRRKIGTKVQQYEGVMDDLDKFEDLKDKYEQYKDKL